MCSMVWSVPYKKLYHLSQKKCLICVKILNAGICPAVVIRLRFVPYGKLNCKFNLFMLNLPIAMFFVKGRHPLFWFPALVGWLASLVFLPVAANAQDLAVEISAPRPGEALQGVVEIRGTTGLEGFQSAEISFAYQDDATATWFLIQQSNQPVVDGPLARWDTSTITDGRYRMRVQVFLQDGQVLEYVVDGLRVRNYSPVETSTPAVLPTGQPTPTLTVTPLMDFAGTAPVLTPLPTNPAELTGQHLTASIFQGVLVIFGAAVIAGVYLGLRWLIRS